MRLLIAVVVLLLIAPLLAFAGDPPGGPGWYQLDVTQIVDTPSGKLVIAAGTPGFLVGASSDGLTLRIRFERGVATWLGAGREITTDGGFGGTLTIDVKSTDVSAFVKQPLSSATPGSRRGGAEPGALGALGGGVTGAGLGGTRGVNVARDTNVTVEDRQNVVTVTTPPAASLPDQRRGSSDAVPPAGTAVGGGGGGGTTRVIAREEHDEWLRKVLGLLGEDGARCETKGYGPGWVSICEPRAA